MMESRKGLYLLLGISLITQATTSIIGGIVGVGPFTDTGDIAATMNNMVENIGSFYWGMFLQVITALVIIVLAVALYQAGRQICKSAAMIAVGFYLLEVVLVIINQMLIYGITEVASQYHANGNAGLLDIAELMFSMRNFGGAIAMLPFGLGALLFYYLIMRANVIPRWLGLWGLITVPFILVGWTLAAFGVSVPFALYVPYVPWEWIAGIYILIRALKIPNIPKSAGCANES